MKEATRPHLSKEILLRIFEKGSEEYVLDVENLPGINDDGKSILKSFPARMRQVNSHWRSIIDGAPLSSQTSFRIAHVELLFSSAYIDETEGFKFGFGLSPGMPRIVDILSRFRRNLAHSANCDLVVTFNYPEEIAEYSEINQSIRLFIQGMRFLLPFRTQVRGINIDVTYARALREVLATLRSLDTIPNLTFLMIRSGHRNYTSDYLTPRVVGSPWPPHLTTPPKPVSARYPSLRHLIAPAITYIFAKEVMVLTGLASLSCQAPDGPDYVYALRRLSYLLELCNCLGSVKLLWRNRNDNGSSSTLLCPISLSSKELDLHIDSGDAFGDVPIEYEWKAHSQLFSFPRLRELSLSTAIPETLIPALGLFVSTEIKVLDIFISLLLYKIRLNFWEEMLESISMDDLKTVLGALRPQKLTLRHPVHGPVHLAMFALVEVMILTSLLSMTIDISFYNPQLGGSVFAKRCHYFYDRSTMYLDAQSLTELKLIGIPQSRLFNYTAELITPNLVDVTIHFLVPSLEVLAQTGYDNPNKHPPVQYPVPSVRRLQVVSSVERVMSTVPFLTQLFPGVESLVLKSYRDTEAERRYSLDIGKQCDLVSFHLSPSDQGIAFPKLVTLTASFVGTPSVEKGDDYP